MTRPDTTDQPIAPTHVRLGLAAVADSAIGRQLDGVWWPRTNRPLDELAALVAALESPRDRVVKLMLSMAGWGSWPQVLPLQDRAIPVFWLGLYRDLLIARLTGRRLNLMVIPPGTPPAVAVTATKIALDPSNQTPSPGVLARAQQQRDNPPARLTSTTGPARQGMSGDLKGVGYVR
jgi:hypothetical protein